MTRLALVALAIASAACSSNTKDDAAPPTDASADAGLDCAFFAGTNCFTAFVESVAECLGPASGETGIMDIDDRTCTYASIGRRVAFNTSLGTSIDGGSPGRADVHFTATNMAGKTCLEHTEKKGDLGFKSVGPSGTFELSYVGNAVTLACPDGTKKTGDVAKLRSTCGADFDQKLPGTYWSETLPKFVFHPGTTLVYQCYRLRGGDGDAGGDAAGD